MAVEFRDYYEVLGIPRSADEKAIRAAYRQLARKYHPDVNPGDNSAESKFKEINEAYEVLSDPEKRSKYDELGARWKDYDAWQRARQAAGKPGASPGDWSDLFRAQESTGHSRSYATNAEDLQDLFGTDAPYSDFFETFFVGGRQSARPHRGLDLEAQVEIDFSEAVSGATRIIDIPRPGGGSRRIEARIPPGVDDGTRIRLAGQGEPGNNGGPSGDLYLVTRVKPSPIFSRIGDQLRLITHAPLTRMLLGGEIEVHTPTGRVALKLPPGTTDGQTFRLRGQGMPKMAAPQSRGDLEVEVHVTLPLKLTAEQRRLIETFAELEGAAAAAESAA
ncbi:MAG: DnaJ C-terminal domain-containing protein [Chloroflexota bacterium]